MHVDPSAELVQTLNEAYRYIRKDLDLATASPLLDGVLKIIRIYAENMQVEPLEIISTWPYGVVLTKESAIVGGKPATWRGIHLWRFEATLRAQFEAYSQTMVVFPPGLRPQL